MPYLRPYFNAIRRLCWAVTPHVPPFYHFLKGFFTEYYGWFSLAATTVGVTVAGWYWYELWLSLWTDYQAVWLALLIAAPCLWLAYVVRSPCCRKVNENEDESEVQPWCWCSEGEESEEEPEVIPSGPHVRTARYDTKVRRRIRAE